MKRLFCVKDVNGKKLKHENEVFYTDNKIEAKSFRDSARENGKMCRVSLGPDHIGPHGHQSNRRRLESNKPR